MARAPNEKVNKAYELFKEGYKLIDISKKLDIPSGTVRRWKKTYNWDNERSDKNSERSLNKNSKKSKGKEPIADEVKEVLENTELTDKQRLFCIYYINCFNATKAYQKAYGCSYIVANVEGYRTLVKPSIKAEIEKLKQHKLNKAMISEEDIFQRYLDIAYANLGDYLSFGKRRKNRWTKNEDGEFIPVIDPDTGEQDFYEYNFVTLNESSDVDTSLISEVKEGKDGVSIKLKDGMRALDWLTKHMNIATDKQKAEVERIKAQTNKITGDDQEIEDTSETEGEIYGD